MKRGAASFAVAFAAGALLSLAFPEADLSPLAWVCPAVLIALVHDAGERGARKRFLFGLGYAFGLGFFGTLLIWVSHVGYVAWIVLVLFQSVFAGAFAIGLGVLSRSSTVVTRVVGAVVLWVAVIEYLRQIVPIVGFTWGQLAQSQHDLGWMLRPARLGGGWAVAAFVIAAAALLAEAYGSWRRKDRRGVVLMGGLAVMAVAIPALVPLPTVDGDALTVAIVQGNVPRDIPEGFERDLAILHSHAELTEELAGEDVDLVVWPESAVAIDPFRFPEVGGIVGDAARSVGVPMIVGATLDQDEDHYLVVALLVSAEGEIVDRYQKTHLVPFGEYVPARGLFSWLPLLDQIPNDAVMGDEHNTFEIAGEEVAPVLSFEGDFGSLVRRPIDAGGRLLVVATNTSTWGESWASAQHLAFSQVRAVENGVWVVHGAISGISAFAQPDGTVTDATDLWTTDTLIQEVRFATSETFYTRFGDWLPWACWIAVGVLLAMKLRAARRATDTVAA